MRRQFKTGAVACAVAIVACGGDSQGPTFQPIEGVTGKLAFTNSVERGQIEYQLRELDFATGALRTIYTAPTHEQIWSISWRPDGLALAMTIRNLSTTTNDVFSLRRVNEDGTQAFGLFNGSGPEGGAAYSPTGKLAYCGGFDPDAALFVDGVSIIPASCAIASPGWFPDGSAVALVATIAGINGLHRVDLASHTATLLLAATPPWNASTPAVSPDGSMIAVPVADAAGWNIHLIPVDGSAGSVLPGTADADQPQWSADGSRLVYQQGFRPFVRNLATGSVTRIMDTRMLSIAWHP